MIFITLRIMELKIIDNIYLEILLGYIKIVFYKLIFMISYPQIKVWFWIGNKLHFNLLCCFFTFFMHTHHIKLSLNWNIVLVLLIDTSVYFIISRKEDEKLWYEMPMFNFFCMNTFTNDISSFSSFNQVAY